MDDHVANREMMFTGVVIALAILSLAWQVLRTLSRGAMDATGAIRLVCTLIGLGVMCYVGYTIFSIWT